MTELNTNLVLRRSTTLAHSGKDSGLSGAFGVGSGTGPLGGGSMVERNLNRWTIFFSILFLLNAIILLKRPWA